MKVANVSLAENLASMMMTEQAAQQNSDERKRRRWWRPYLAFLGIALFIFSLLVLFLAIVVPTLAGEVIWSSALPLSARLFYAMKYMFLGEMMWPSFFWVLIPAALLLIVYVSKQAGPLHRFQVGAGELQQGNLALRIRLRQNDQLKFQKLAQALNEAIATLERSVAEIRDREKVQRTAQHRCLEAMRAQPSCDPELKIQLELAIKEGEHIDTVLQRFKFTTNE